MIEITNLSKHYGEKAALANVSLTFSDNKIYGLLGSNGAGKTTLMKIIANRLFQTAGTVTVQGQPVLENERVQQNIFCVTENDKYPKDIKLKNLLVWESRFFPDFDLDYAKDLAQKFDLDLNKKTNSLSTGYYTILKVVVALASKAKIMILDEPVLGIDSLYRELFYEVLLTHHRQYQNLIIISTHLIEEVEPVLQEVVIIDRGRIIKQGTLQEIAENESLNQAYVNILKGVRHG